MLSLAVLVLSSYWMVKSLVIIARFLRMSEFLAAYIIVAISTSLPELFIGINAAINLNPSLAFGTVIGANLVNLSLVAGIGFIIIGKFTIKSKEIKKDSLHMFFIALVPLFLMILGGRLSRVDGVILLLIFVVYNYLLIKKNLIHTKLLENHVKKYQTIIAPIIFVICLFLLFASSHFSIIFALELSGGLGIPLILVGLILISLGTTLPELSFTVSSLLNHHGELSLGNLVGSVITNSTLVLGVTALIFPITVGLFTFLIASLFMVFVLFLFVTFIGNGKLGYKEGISLIGLYVMFVIIQIYVNVI